SRPFFSRDQSQYSALLEFRGAKDQSRRHSRDGWELNFMAIRWDKLTVKSQQAMQQAQERATEFGNPEIQPVHLLLALVEDREGGIPAELEKIGVPTERLRRGTHKSEE